MESNFINDYLYQFFDEIEPMEFYRNIFPLGELERKNEQVQGKYNAIAVELLPRENKQDKQNVRRYIINDDLEVIEELLKSENFIIVSPISYAGRRRKSELARRIYAIAFDVDGIDSLQNLRDLFHQIDMDYLPKPTYVVSSGSGLHLYYQLIKPIECYPNVVKQLQALKRDLTTKIWNGYVSTLSDNIQYESLFQGFRLVGGITKAGLRTRVFETGEKVSIEYLNEFVIDEKNKVKDIKYKSDLTLAEAKEKFPSWYEKRVINKRPKGTWQTSADLFYWWEKKIRAGAIVGHRYYCVMILAVMAKKAGIDEEELERVAFGLVEYLDSLTTSYDNHFTREDVLSALEAYQDSYITFPIDSIVRLTNIPIEKNKRNYRKQELHLKLARSNKAILKEAGEMKREGRPKKDKEIIQWRLKNPKGTKAQCIRETGISRPTVDKYWSMLDEDSKTII